MPINKELKYNPPFIFRNKHLHTITPSLFRKVILNQYNRQTIVTEDDDFIDFDYYTNNSKKAVILLHGLEGNSRKPYMLGMIKSLLNVGFDAFAVNLRGCSGRHNSQLSSYHAGKTDDLALMVQYVSKMFDYEQIVLVGFSLGGNIALKYIGETGNQIPQIIKAAIGISVPCDLASTSRQMSKPSNFLYLIKFMRLLKQKALYKTETFDAKHIRKTEIRKAKNFYQFDEIFTAPVHGFKNALDYWEKCSSKAFLKNITIPTLIINALDDPFLTPVCYPYEEAKQNQNLHLMFPDFGGHVGFANNLFLKNEFWHEQRVVSFVNNLVDK